MGETRLFELAGGRELAWTECGPLDGAPVVAFHGSPGTRHFFAPLADTAARHGVRLIAPDRPGYGHSTYHPGRTYETWAGDVAQLADHLGVVRFAVVGPSSGGPNAAACARFLGERVVGCAVVSSPAPPEAGLSETGMSLSSRIAQRLATAAPGLTGSAFEMGLRLAQRGPDKAMALAQRTLPACDAAIMERPEIRDAIREELVRPVASTAGRAAIQDLGLELTPWGFRLEDLALPVHVWHGDQDQNVSVESGVYLASAIPGAILHRVPNEGHLLIYGHFGEILESLAA
jgi:pimeloyl-ACP methyl ester carboxylesterase